MVKKWFIAATLFLTLALAIAGCAGPSVIRPNLSQQTGIWVTGMGQIFAAPDIASITLGIQAQETTVKQAQDEAAAAMNKVMSALTGNGVDQKDIKTQAFSIQQVTRYDNNTQQQTVLGYQVTNLVTAKIRTLDKTGAIIDSVATAGGEYTRVNGISFSVEKPETYYDQLRQMAITDASNKAKQLAKLSGVSLGEPVYINENIQLPYPPPLGIAAPAPSIQTPISPGQTQITINVQVVYAIQ